MEFLRLGRNLKKLLTFVALNNIIYLGYKIGGENVVAKKIGRPTDNPKSTPIHIRLDEESEQVLSAYCKQENVPRAEGVRRGIKKLADDIKK